MNAQNRKKRIEKELAKARQAFSAAELLVEQAHFEAAINRTYYSVFHAARAALLTLGLQPRTHKGVNQQFNEMLVLRGKIEPEYLSALGHSQMQREFADYSIDVEFSVEQAVAELDSARRFLSRIEDFLHSTEPI